MFYQCEICGCADHSDFGWYHKPVFKPAPEFVDRRLCSACGPTHFENGRPTGLGEWHGRFPRVYHPLGSMMTDSLGNLIPRSSFLFHALN